MSNEDANTFSPLTTREALIDIAALDELTLGDTEFQQEILETYVEDMPTCLAKLKQAFGDRNWNDFVSHAHQIKGASRTACVKSIPDIAERLEACGSDLEENEIRGLIEKLEILIDRVRDCARDWDT
ncbi:Hpt domain-containing protein [Baaleninema simplex]|uniref:Hpt domain-containing protein n=1 Tax=Baaleninema simplex TaxID=2862350 RepID=UPI00034AFF70|nr:Hpt domain-containing protein [Baaleninema simplex]